MKKAVEAVSLTAILYLILSAFAVVLILSRSCLLVKRIHLFVTFHYFVSEVISKFCDTGKHAFTLFKLLCIMYQKSGVELRQLITTFVTKFVTKSVTRLTAYLRYF